MTNPKKGAKPEKTETTINIARARVEGLPTPSLTPANKKKWRDRGIARAHECQDIAKGHGLKDMTIEFAIDIMRHQQAIMYRSIEEYNQWKIGFVAEWGCIINKIYDTE